MKVVMEMCDKKAASFGNKLRRAATCSIFPLLAGWGVYASGAGLEVKQRSKPLPFLQNRAAALTTMDRRDGDRKLTSPGPSGAPSGEPGKPFSAELAEEVASRIEGLRNGGAEIKDMGAFREAVAILPAFKRELAQFENGDANSLGLVALCHMEANLENLEGAALKGRHRAGVYRPDGLAALPDGLSAYGKEDSPVRLAGTTTKINTGWVLDQHVFDPIAPKQYPTILSDFKHYDEGWSDIVMGHSEQPTSTSEFGWVWEVESFYWTDTATVTDHANPSCCLFVMVSGDGGFTWQLYEILYDPTSVSHPTSLDMINPKMTMDITTVSGGRTYDRYYIAYEYCQSSTDHDVYVYSDNSTLPFYDGTAGGTSSPKEVGVATSTSWEGNPAIAADYKTTDATRYRVVAYEYEYGATDHDIYASQSSDDGSTWSTPVAVAATSGMETNPALAAGCSGGTTFTSYIHLAYNYDTYTSSGAQILLNPGFESGNNGNWTVRVATDIDGSGAHSRTGTYCAWLGGVANNPSWPGDWIYQAVAIPPGVQSSTFSLWVKITSSDSATDAHDFFYADVRDVSGNLLQNLVTLSNADQGTYSSYQQLNLDISKFRGQTVRIYLWSTNDASLTTSFFVDDTALSDGVYATDSEIRYAKAAHPGTDYPSGLASATQLAVLANSGGIIAWPYGPPAIAATHGGTTTVTGSRVLVAADQFFPQDQPSAGNPARYQLKFAVNTCNGSTSCGNIAGCTTTLSLNWNAYYWNDPTGDYRFPALVVDGVGWVQGASSLPQNGIVAPTSTTAGWNNEIFMGYYYRARASTSLLGDVKMDMTDASDETCTGFASGAWYYFTASEKASDNDEQVVPKQGTIVAFNYFAGWPGMGFNKRLNHAGATMNDDVYFTTLGDNYTIDTTSSGTHIDAYWTFNTVSYVGPWTYAWPAGYGWALTADASEIYNFRYYTFSTWSTGDANAATTINSSYCAAAGACPITSIYAYYGGGCLVSPPSVTGLMVTQKSGSPVLAWLQAGQLGDVQQYTVYRATSPGSASNFAAIGTAAGTDFTDSAAGGPLYYYVVVADCGPYSGPWDCYGQ